jgi:hypothetical protein
MQHCLTEHYGSSFTNFVLLLTEKRLLTLHRMYDRVIYDDSGVLIMAALTNHSVLMIDVTLLILIGITKLFPVGKV